MSSNSNSTSSHRSSSNKCNSSNCHREKKKKQENQEEEESTADASSVVLMGSTNALEVFTESVGSFWCPSNVAILNHNNNNNNNNTYDGLQLPCNPLLFARNFVQKSLPCIIRNGSGGGGVAGITTTTSLPQWTVSDIQSICGDDFDITVNVTPDGHGDAIHTTTTTTATTTATTIPVDGNRVFVLPEERRMKLGQFVNSMRNANPTSCQGCDDDVDTDELRTGPEKRSISQNKSTCHTMSGTATSTTTTTGSSTDGVYYYSMQNDCLRSEFGPLIPHVESASQTLLAWAEEAFGTGPPDAVNLWIGNEFAHSSLHKDHYENLFYVASGEKVFTLYPPANAACLTVKTFPTHRFCFDCDTSTHRNNDQTTATTYVADDDDDDHNYNNNTNASCHWRMVPELDDDGIQLQTPWIDLTASPTSHLHPLTVVVQAGDILYLPSLWFHAVTQTCETVGINWWFDMDWNSPLWCYFQLLENCRLQYVKDETDEDSY